VGLDVGERERGGAGLAVPWAGLPCGTACQSQGLADRWAQKGKELYGFSLYFSINKEMVLGSGK
jgi:hypothetical protein